ncbi:hypothetical protein PthstB1num2_00150 [Parageobacillus thermoglucosidasius]|nr:hypothetical protein PthstB1num2_00150 [Parageobacillus thermoglucosidasius]
MKRRKRGRKYKPLTVSIAERLPEVAVQLGFKGDVK